MSKIKLTKINSGIIIELQKPMPRSKDGKKKVLEAALKRYLEEVVLDLGYFINYESRIDLVHISTLFLDLEPWGFAIPSENGSYMNDTGSVATPARCKILEAYQKPLEHHQEDNLHSWWSIWEV